MGHPDIHTFNEDTEEGTPLTDCEDGGGGCAWHCENALGKTACWNHEATDQFGITLLAGFVDGHCPYHSKLA